MPAYRNTKQMPTKKTSRTTNSMVQLNKKDAKKRLLKQVKYVVAGRQPYPPTDQACNTAFGSTKV
jgi:uracil DNA glycosylase